MAEIRRTTMVPGKLELLSRWMAEQPWYLGKNGPPALTKAGGFRLDDPIGEVGIEFMFVTDASEQETDIYHVPLSYRGAPLKGAGVGLLGTAEHGVLGRRWIYDGAHDPVVVAGLLALAQGAAEPQHQNLSDTPDPSVAGRASGAVRLTASGSPPSPPRSDGSRTSIDLVAVDQSGAAAGRSCVFDVGSGLAVSNSLPLLANQKRTIQPLRTRATGGGSEGLDLAEPCESDL